jgi:hypothetical protein
MPAAKKPIVRQQKAAIRARAINAMRIEVRAKPTLDAIERQLGSLSLLDEEAPVSVWLSREMGPKFFVEGRVVALLLSAARRNSLQVIDWTGTDLGEWRTHFEQTLAGVAAAAYSPDVKTAAGQLLNIDFVQLKAAIELKGGMLETDARPGSRVFTLCAFDVESVRRPPLVLATAITKADFQTELYQRIHAQDFVAKNDVPDRPRKAESALADFVFELFQNTHEHGCLSRDHRFLRGLRFLQIKRHIAGSKRDLLLRAQGFTELADFLNRSVSSASRDIKFCEIGVGDQGVGIMDRLVATRPELAREVETWQGRCRFINEIVRRSLSSKLGIAGAGHGIENVLTDIRDLEGFVTVRTGDTWLFYAGTPSDRRKKPTLLPVGSGAWPRVSGTHVSILFPLR